MKIDKSWKITGIEKRGNSMTFIYSFLQKRKMHENHSGMIMVVMAYVLSILMLALGSDVFYNINSSAAGTKSKDEETKKIAIEETYRLSASFVQNDTYLQNDSYSISPLLQTNLINPYNLKDTSEAAAGEAQESDDAMTEETVWFLGSAMDSDTFNTLMGQLEHIVPDASEVEKEKQFVKVTAYGSVINVTEEDIKMLERIVQAEASGEDIIGKILVANVIFNRIADEDFPDTVEGVIFQKSSKGYQFSPVANKKYWSVKVSKETKKAVQRALEGENHSEGALYFIARKRTSGNSAKWFDKNLKWLFKHGGHEFFR